MYTGHLSELERRINSYGRGNLVFSDEGICTVWHLFSLDAKLCLSHLVNERQGTVVVTWRDKQETAWSLWTGLREYTLPYLPGLDLSSEATWLTCDFLKAFMDFDLKRREFDFYFNKIKHLDYERDNMITKFHQQVLYGTCLTSN